MNVKGSAEKLEDTITEEMTVCPFCNYEVAADDFCAVCGMPLNITKPVKTGNDEDIEEDVDFIPKGSKVFMGVYRPEAYTGALTMNDDGEIVEEFVPETEGYEVLVDSYRATIGTVGGDGYRETVLYVKDSDYQIHCYTRKGDEVRETHTAYQADKNCADELFAIIAEEGIKDYEGKTGEPPAGVLEV
ncbi:MAG: hypothetical protein IKE38_00265, partial [Erysipelotrichaceae bacterium]|nr:hypothetical protein [Erysipelotrichaceae bacterium]